MFHIVSWVRELRRVQWFSVSIKLLVISLMLLGVWVATRKLDFPPGVKINDKVIHVFVFFCFALLMDLTSSRKPFWLWKGLPLLSYGLLIEVFQFFTPNRNFSLLDLFADFFGIFLYTFLKYLLYLFVVNRVNN
ncbi:MAG: VanZ family protein [Cocleimonas sp.]